MRDCVIVAAGCQDAEVCVLRLPLLAMSHSCWESFATLRSVRKTDLARRRKAGAEVTGSDDPEALWVKLGILRHLSKTDGPSSEPKNNAARSDDLMLTASETANQLWALGVTGESSVCTDYPQVVALNLEFFLLN